MKKNVTLTIDYDIYEQARKQYKNLSAYFQRLLENMLKNDTEDYLKTKKEYKAQQRINKRKIEKIKKLKEEKVLSIEEKERLSKIANYHWATGYNDYDEQKRTEKIERLSKQ